MAVKPIPQLMMILAFKYTSMQKSCVSEMFGKKY